MSYSIGYQRLDPCSLLALAVALDADVVDVRSVPASRKPGFARASLAAQLGPRYIWAGDRLGGRSPGPSQDGLLWLATRERSSILLCLEEAPGDCHRHSAIAVPLLELVDILHIYQDVVVRASELARAIRDDDDYECSLLEPASKFALIAS